MTSGREYYIPTHTDIVRGTEEAIQILKRVRDQAPDNLRAELDLAMRKLVEVESYLKSMGVVNTG